MSSPTTPRFRRLLRSIGNAEVVVPLLQSALWQPDFKSFTVPVKGFEERKPDGLFHPSTHPLWPERQLYYYLAEPEKLVSRPFDPHSTIAITQGNFWHEFLQHILLDIGYLKGAEIWVEDKETGSGGSMDGETRDDEVFEIKTMDDRKAGKFPDGPPDSPELLEYFKVKCPDYFAQGQEYMRISGLSVWRGLFVTLRYPFPMREIVMTPDRKFQHEIAEKYRRVRQAVADLEPPRFCCAPGSADSKSCLARLTCPHGVQ